jgi:hypothetical protein
MPYPKKSATSRAIARDRSAQAKWKRVRFRDNRLPETKDAANTLSTGGCWCGEPFDHDWPGRDEGAPHPLDRVAPPGLTPKQLEREARLALQAAGVCPIATAVLACPPGSFLPQVRLKSVVESKRRRA